MSWKGGFLLFCDFVWNSDWEKQKRGEANEVVDVVVVVLVLVDAIVSRSLVPPQQLIQFLYGKMFVLVCDGNGTSRILPLLLLHLSHSLSQSFSLSLTYTVRTHSCSLTGLNLSFYLSLSHTHTHTHPHSLFHYLTSSLILSLSLSHSLIGPWLDRQLFLSLSIVRHYRDSIKKEPR